MKIYSAIIIACILASCGLFSSCENAGENGDNNLTIIAGQICGWCAGIDSVVITRETTKFESADCDNKISEIKPTEKSDWVALKGTLDLGEFSKTEINTCYVCADGCDYWVEIRSSSFRHRVRYGLEDSATVVKIKPFLDQVHSLRVDFKERILLSDTLNGP